MKRFIKYLAFTIILVILFLAALSFVVGLMFGDSRGCGKESEAADYARSLSQERLTKLYSDMEYYYRKNESKSEEFNSFDSGSFPKEFEDLEVVRIRLGESHIMVEGCFDNYMYMYFRGVGNNEEEKEIVLSYGEFETINEKLWPK